MCMLSIALALVVDRADLSVAPSGTDGPHPPQSRTNAHVAILMRLDLQTSITQSTSLPSGTSRQANWRLSEGSAKFIPVDDSYETIRGVLCEAALHQPLTKENLQSRRGVCVLVVERSHRVDKRAGQ